jgi:hypothetical protein
MRLGSTNLPLVWMAVLGIAAMPGCGRKPEAGPPLSAQDAGPPLPAVVPAEQLRQTDVLPHTSGKIVPGRNYLYCATFQLAWNTFGQEVLGEPIRLEGTPQMAEDLNRAAKLGEKDLPAGAYLAKAGWVKDGIVDQIRAEMKKRFPKATFQLPEGAGQQTAIAYAYLQRSLPFREAFNRLPDPLKFKSKDGEIPVAAFGFSRLGHSPRDGALRGQVTVLSYVDNDNFVLRLKTTVQDDELVLAKVTPETTLQDTLSSVFKRSKSATGNDYAALVQDDEPLVVPVMSIGVSRRYKELEGRAFQNPKGSGQEISVTCQGIRFRLDETGARLESAAYIEEKDKAAPPSPRRFIFDKPFLAYLKRKSSEVPYFAMWVETPEVLEKAAK